MFDSKGRPTIIAAVLAAMIAGLCGYWLCHNEHAPRWAGWLFMFMIYDITTIRWNVGWVAERVAKR